MESQLKESKLEEMDLFPYKSEQKIKLFQSYPQAKNFTSKFKKRFNGNNKYYFNGNQRFLKYKRKNKKNRNEMPETPHNTGQYLAHIHQELASKRKTCQDGNEVDELDLNRISCFDDDIDDIGDFDFDFINDKKRERLMSMEGKELHDFIFKRSENENDENNKSAKSEISLQEIQKENDLGLKNNESSNL